MMKMPTAGYKSHTFPDMASQISTESLAAMEIIKFPGKIVTVNTENEAFSAVESLRKESVVGIDTETRPSFKKGVIHSVALVQISTWDVCYLFRICRMKDVCGIRQILESTDILKIGLSLNDDFTGLRRLTPLTPHHYLELQQYATAFGIEEMSLQKIYALLFGKKISKNQQLSNWEAPELSTAQQLYAATDAWACLHIYKALKGEELPAEYREIWPIKKTRNSEKRFIQK